MTRSNGEGSFPGKAIERQYRTIVVAGGKFKIEVDETVLLELEVLAETARALPAGKGLEASAAMLGSFDARHNALHIQGLKVLSLEHTSGESLIMAKTVPESGEPFMLLVEPSGDPPLTARLYRESGETGWECVGELVLTGMRLDAAAVTGNRFPAAAQAVSVPASASANRLGIVIGVAAAIVILVCLAAWRYAALQRPAESPRQATTLGLSLSLRRTGATVRWNPGRVEDGATGTLIVEENRRRVEYQLSAGELRAGLFDYPDPVLSGSVRLEVHGPNIRDVAETVLVVGNDSALPFAIASDTADPSDLAKPAGYYGQARVIPPASVVDAPAGTESTVTGPAKAFVLPEPAKVVDPSIDEPPPPVVGGASLIARALPRAATLTPVPYSAPPPPEPSPLKPEPAAGQPRAASPQLPAVDPVVLQSALATRQVQPVVPANLRPMLTRDVVTTVSIIVDASGRVTEANLMPVTSSMERMLGNLAVEAVRHWTFRPATRNGKPMPSRTTVQFRFARPAR